MFWEHFMNERRYPIIIWALLWPKKQQFTNSVPLMVYLKKKKQKKNNIYPVVKLFLIIAHHNSKYSSFKFHDSPQSQWFIQQSLRSQHVHGIHNCFISMLHVYIPYIPNEKPNLRFKHVCNSSSSPFKTNTTAKEDGQNNIRKCCSKINCLKIEKCNQS